MKSTPIFTTILNLPELKYLYHDCDMTIEEIAQKIGVGSSTVHRRLKNFGLLKDKKAIYDKIDKSRRKTFMISYGVDHYMKSMTGYNNYKLSLLKSNGVESIWHIRSVVEKQQQTHFDRYGVRFSIQNPVSDAKRLKTLEERYGNYRKHLSRISAENHKSFNSALQTITTRFGTMIVRSKLEANTIKKIAEIDGITSLCYEPLNIECDDFYIIPDLLINNNTIVEIKYHKYISCRIPHNLDSKGTSMRSSAQRKIPVLRKWCNDNNYKFCIITERDIKSHHRLATLLL